MHRRVRAALAGIALMLGLLTPAPVLAETVPAQPAPQTTVTATAGGDTTETQSARSGTTLETPVASGSLSRKKTIAALILGFVVAAAAAVFALRRSARDNRLG